jgi:hypothetical protein
MEDDGTNRLVGRISLERQTAPPTVNCERLKPELRTVNPLEPPSENYGSGEHTTVAAFLPWRGL